MTRHNETWTAEQKEMLSKLYGEGLPDAQIGERMGKTKNAIVGKRWRMKLLDQKPQKHWPLESPNDSGCQYPFGDKNFTFCGKDKAHGSYCQEHHDICYRTDEPKEPKHHKRGWMKPSLIT